MLNFFISVKDRFYLQAFKTAVLQDYYRTAAACKDKIVSIVYNAVFLKLFPLLVPPERQRTGEETGAAKHRQDEIVNIID